MTEPDNRSKDNRCLSVTALFTGTTASISSINARTIRGGTEPARVAAQKGVRRFHIFISGYLHYA